MSFNLAQVLKELGITEDFIEASQMPPARNARILLTPAWIYLIGHNK